jgi:tetratricopeptide (TPR) repeat protein
LLFSRIPRIEEEKEEADEEAESIDLFVDGMYRDAAERLEQALESGYQTSGVYYMLAEIYDKFKNPYRAFKFCCQSIDKDPNRLDAYKLRVKVSRILLKTELKERAQESLEQDIARLQEFGITV